MASQVYFWHFNQNKFNNPTLPNVTYLELINFREPKLMCEYQLTNVLSFGLMLFFNGVASGISQLPPAAFCIFKGRINHFSVFQQITVLSCIRRYCTQMLAFVGIFSPLYLLFSEQLQLIFVTFTIL